MKWMNINRIYDPEHALVEDVWLLYLGAWDYFNIERIYDVLVAIDV